MGCDAYATKEGKFKIEIRSYDTGKVLGIVDVEDLEEAERIIIDIHEGTAR